MPGISAGTAYVDIVPRFKKFARELDKQTASAGAGLRKFGGKLSSAGNKLTLGLTLPLVALGKTAFDAASDLNESLSKVNVVFADSSDEIVAWSKTTAKSLGQSQQQALEAAGTFGNLFRALGLAVKPAADMSIQLVKLASDLASFNNASPEDVLIALRAGLVGEVEPLRKFGVSLNAARIQAEALALGLVKPVKSMAAIELAQKDVATATKAANAAIKRHGEDSIRAQPAILALEKANKKLELALKGEKVELNAAQKAQAAFSIITKDTALAQGDFARTSDGAANKQRILTAQFKDAAATIGTKLLPIGTKLLGFATDLFEKFQGLSPQTQDLILKLGLVALALGPVVKIGGTLAKTMGAMKKAFALARAAIVRFTGAKAAEKAVMEANNRAAASGTKAIGGLRGAVKKAAPALAAAGKAAGTLGAAYALGTVSTENLQQAHRNATKQAREFIKELRAGRKEALNTSEGLQGLSNHLVYLAKHGERAAVIAIKHALALQFGQNAANRAAAAAEKLIGRIALEGDAWRAVTPAMARATQATRVIEQALRRVIGLPPSIQKRVETALVGVVDGQFTNFRRVEDRLKAIKNLSPTIRKQIIAKLRAELEASARIRNIILDSRFASVYGNEPRQHGGPVRPGRSYLVGERGPELRTFSRSGWIHSNAELQRMVATMEREASDSHDTINVNVYNPKPERLELSVPAAMRRAELARARG